MLKVPISECFDAVMEFCRENRSPESVARYQKACDYIGRLYAERSHCEYDPQLHEELIQASRKKIIENDIPSILRSLLNTRTISSTNVLFIPVANEKDILNPRSITLSSSS